ncbi:MAG: cold shock domain-containing protein, partial [Nitriliruptor sp.]
MPTGRVKIFHAERNFGFLTTADGDEIYVAASEVEGGSLRSGDEVEVEVADGEGRKRAATGVTV